MFKPLSKKDRQPCYTLFQQLNDTGVSNMMRSDYRKHMIEKSVSISTRYCNHRQYIHAVIFRWSSRETIPLLQIDANYPNKTTLANIQNGIPLCVILLLTDT